MTEHLTETNGVVCVHCFRTIDLTKLSWADRPKLAKALQGVFGQPAFFYATCYHCKQSARYSYDKDVKPISNDEKILVSKKQIDELVEKAIKSTGDAKIIARELKNTPTSTEEPESDSTLPPDHSIPSNHPEKKKPDFYG